MVKIYAVIAKDQKHQLPSAVCVTEDKEKAFKYQPKEGDTFNLLSSLQVWVNGTIVQEYMPFGSDCWQLGYDIAEDVKEEIRQKKELLSEVSKKSLLLQLELSELERKLKFLED